MMKNFNEKQYYSIGETAEICGVSVQTLRYYSKMGLVSPAYISDSSGYRYYLPEQFQLIDRVKYLQRFGFSLEEIQAVYKNGGTGYLKDCLERQKLIIREKRDTYDTLLREISSYCDSFHPISTDYPDIPMRQYFEERYVLLESGKKGETTNQIYRRLLRMKNLPEYRTLPCQFQFVFPIDFEDFCRIDYSPTGCGMLLSTKPEVNHKNVLTLPAGEYLCTQSKLRRGIWDPSLVREIFRNRPAPRLAIAEEIETSISDFDDSIFIVQFYLGD
ncbi:MAG: MerR family transcriptional regulator [Oscillospiraceae bacterium]|nr:MerR family transcriptional regulator [Oscillospiraceae bacterium]